MRAITYSAFGPAKTVLELAQLDVPALAAGEITVALAYSGVNPSDVKSRAGRPGLARPAFDRIIPHSDGAGEITAVGAGIDPARLGERVWIWNGQWQRPFGTAAEQITLPAEMAVSLPAGTSLQTGAVLGIPGLTAAEAVFGGGDIKGTSILISGGGGTVGFLAVQLAKWAGARVFATCSPRDMDRVRAAGAEHVFDYRAPDLAAQVLSANDGVAFETVVEVEFGLNIGLNASVIAPNGRLAVYGSAKDMSPQMPFFEMLFKAVNIDIILIYLLPLSERQARIAQLHAALADGALHCPVAEILALEDTASAHQLVEAGGRTGAVLIDCQN